MGSDRAPNAACVLYVSCWRGGKHVGIAKTTFRRTGRASGKPDEEDDPEGKEVSHAVP